MTVPFLKWVSVNIKRRLLGGFVLLLTILLFVQVFIVINSKQEQKVQFTTFANIVADAIRNNNLVSVQKISLILLRDLKGQWVVITDSNEKILWSYPPQKEVVDNFLFKHISFRIESIYGPLDLVASIPLIPNLPVFAALVFGTVLFILLLLWAISGTLKRLSVDFSRELSKLVTSDSEITVDELEQTRQQLNHLKNQEAIQAKKLRDEAALVAVGGIVNHVAHDIRSPLQTLLTSIGRIENKSQGDTEIAAYTDAARQSADRIKLMAEELLDYKKARELQLAPVNIGNLVEDSLKDVLVPASQKGIKITTLVSSRLVLNIDVSKLQRSITNIVLNAIQAIEHDHGVVKIDVIPSPLLITITDNGCGIKQEHLSKIFDCSFTFGKKGGTGLGLAYCQNVVDAHKGTIKVESEINKGTKFIIALPEEVILEKGTQETFEQMAGNNGEAGSVPFAQRSQWLLVANETETKEMWHDLSKIHKAEIEVEIEVLEDLIKKKIDYFSLKGMIVDCTIGKGRLELSDIIDIASYVRSKDVKNIHFCTSDQIPEKFMKRFNTNGIEIQSKPLSETAYNKIFL